jgi:hypothetical protein
MEFENFSSKARRAPHARSDQVVDLGIHARRPHPPTIDVVAEASRRDYRELFS